MSVSNSTLSRPSLEETARKLCESRGGKWSGIKGMARCPAHDDRTPSLGVTLGRKAILLHCFAGCDQARVLAALARDGIETSALFSGSSHEFPIQPSYSSKPSAAALSMFEGTKQRFFAQLLLSMKLRSLIPSMEEALNENHSVVVQLVSTAEAMLDRRLADLSDEEREALGIDLSPCEYVIDYLATSFPVRLMQVFTDEEGNLRSEAMSDEHGNPILCSRAIAVRDALIEQLCALPPIATALDAIIEHFGSEAVAEVTGRTRRLVLGRDGQQRLERRSASANV